MAQGPPGMEPLELVAARHTAGGHADPAEVLLWLLGETPEPWGAGGSGNEDPGVLEAFRRRIAGDRAGHPHSASLRSIRASVTARNAADPVGDRARGPAMPVGGLCPVLRPVPCRPQGPDANAGERIHQVMWRERVSPAALASALGPAPNGRGRNSDRRLVPVDEDVWAPRGSNPEPAG